MMSIFQYSHYKDFLKAYIVALPKKGRGEINRMAEYLRVHPTLISQVLNGNSKDFTAEQGYKLCDYLGLQSIEADYWILLVQRERAGTSEFKKYFSAKIDEIKKTSMQVAKRLDRHHRLTDRERSVFYSSWLYSAIRLFTSVGKGQNADSIAERFSISRSEASRILNFLKNTNLCIEKNGSYYLGPQHTHLEFGSPFLSRHHINWRIKAMQRSENLQDEEMMFTAPFSISKNDFIRIREELMKLIKTATKQIKDSPAEEIACLNLDLFWI